MVGLYKDIGVKEAILTLGEDQFIEGHIQKLLNETRWDQYK